MVNSVSEDTTSPFDFFKTPPVGIESIVTVNVSPSTSVGFVIFSAISLESSSMVTVLLDSEVGASLTDETEIETDELEVRLPSETV